MWVLDASVAVKWFFVEEPHYKEAQSVLSQMTEEPDDFVVPELFFTEFSAVLVRKSKYEKNFVEAAVKIVYELGIPAVPIGWEMQQEAISLACKHHLSLYDAIYIATAKLMKGVWLTADKEAARKLNINLVTKLADFS